MQIINAISPYFLSKYADDPRCHVDVMCRCGNTHTINRPNHSLLHGIRQGILALKVIELLTKHVSPSSAIHKYISCPNFHFHMQAAASFMRSGRSSERNKNNHLDAQHFLKFLPQCTEYGHALQHPSDSVISCILQAAHQLDLRRIVSFNEIRIKTEISRLLFNTQSYCDATVRQHNIIEELWAYSGKLLLITGDRDMVSKRNHYGPSFAYYHKYPERLLSKLNI